MTAISRHPHISGSSLSAQTRYAAGTREILESWFAGTPIRDEYLIVDGGRLAAPAPTRNPRSPEAPRVIGITVDVTGIT